MSETEKAPRKKRGKAPAVVEKPEAPKNDWRSQVDEVAAIDSIEPHPENPNKGDRESIGESIDANGFYGKVLVQKSTRRILVGSHRWAEMKAAGETEIPVTLLDVDDDRALAIMVADNETRSGADAVADAVIAAVDAMEQDVTDRSAMADLDIGIHGVSLAIRMLV